MEGVIEKAPSLLAVAVPISTFPSNKVIVESASALPVIVGVVLSVTEEAVFKLEGAFGAVPSIVIEIEADCDDMLPAESVDFVVKE